MGGYGSTRWNWHTKKQTVEDSLTLNIRSVLQCGSKAGTLATGRGLMLDGQVRIFWNRRAERVTLYHKFNYGQVVQSVRLTATYPFHGKPRWWFACPSCRRRCGCLYRPPGAQRFACRQCHDLSYVARQEHSRHDDRHLPQAALFSKVLQLEQRIEKYKYWCAGARRLCGRLDRLEFQTLAVIRAAEEAASTHR